MVTAMVSELTRRPVRGDLSMTGEITLSGKVLPVGGIKEKVLAAKRAGVKEVILPKQNEKNVKEDLGDELLKGLTIHLVNTIDEVLLLALVHENDRPVKPPVKAKPGQPASSGRKSRLTRPAHAASDTREGVRGSIVFIVVLRAVESRRGRALKVFAPEVDHLFITEPRRGVVAAQPRHLRRREPDFFFTFARRRFVGSSPGSRLPAGSSQIHRSIV